MAAIPDRRWYFTRDLLINSPSRKCLIEPEKELSCRQQAATLIQDMGQRLQVNQLCINTAIVYMHRFYVFHSFQKFPHNSIAAASLFLAAKVEEQPHKLEYVIKVHHACLHRGGPVLDTTSDAYLQQAQELVINESILLQTLGFEVAVDHPHTHVVKCTQMIRGPFNNPFGSPSKDLAQTSYFMATNSLHLTTFCLQYKPTVVACVCIYLVARWSQWEIMKSSDGKDWWEYVDPTVTKELLDELTNEFLKIFDACPSRLKRRILNEKLTSQSRRQRIKEESHSASTSKSIPSSSMSVSSVDSGLPGSGNSESSVNTQESTLTTQGDSLTSLDSSNSDLDKLGLHEINMGLPMIEGFSLDAEYIGTGSYSQSCDSKQGPAGLTSDSEQGRATDHQGHPVKKSLKEYREQKERERMKAAQQNRESAPPRASHTATKPGSLSQHPASLKGKVNSPHLDQRHRESYHSQGSQKHRPEDRHLPLDHRRLEKSSGAHQEQSASQPQPKSSGRPTDLRPTRDQRPHSQHKLNDAAGHPAHGASVTEQMYSKNADQYHKHNRDTLQNSSDKKQHLGPNLQGKDLKRNGLESRDHSANSRLTEAASRVPSTATTSKPHGTGGQRPHHAETLKTHSSEKVLAVESHGKPHSETQRPTKSESHRSQRPENQEIHKLEKHRTATPEMLKLQKSQSLKPQRPEASKLPPSEKQRTQPTLPPLVPLDAAKKQRSGVLPTVGTQKVEPPQPIDHELPRAQRPERVLVQPTDTSKLGKTVTPQAYKQDMSKVQKSEDMFLRRPDVLKIPKTEPGTSSRGGSPSVKSPGASKVKGPEVLKSHKPEVSKSRKTEVPRLLKTDTQDSQKTETQKPQKSDTSRSKESEVARTQKPSVPQQLKAVKEEVKIPELQTSRPEQPNTLTTQRAPQSQPPKPETPKKQRIKSEPVKTQKPTPPKNPNVQVKLEKLPVDKPKPPGSPKPLASTMQTPELDVKDELRVKSETRDVHASASTKQAARKKPLPSQAPKQQAPIPDKPNILSSQKPVTPKPRQPDAHNEKAKLQKAETVTPKKTDTQVKPVTPKSQRSTTPRTMGEGSKPSVSVETPKIDKTNAGGSSETKVVWESVKPLEAPKPGGRDQGVDSESVDADIDKLINAHMAEQSKNQSHEPSLILDLKSTLPQPNITDPREPKQSRDERTLPKSYREKESHHRKKRSEDHRSKSSPHKHRRTADYKKAPPADADGLPGTVDPRGSVSDALGESQPHSSILTTSSGIRLKIKGLSNSLNSGTSGGGKQESSPDPNRQTGSPGLVMKLNLSKMQASQANSEYPPKPEGDEAERQSSHHHRRHHHHKHRKHHHHKSSRSEDRSGTYSRKRSHSRSDSLSSGGRDASPVTSSPPKKRAHNREGHPHPKSLLPSDQSLLSLPMPPMAPSQASAFINYDSAASTGHFSYNTSDLSYNTSDLSHNAPLTTVTALPSSDGFGFYPYDQSSGGHLHPPPPPPREELPPPPPPPPV